MVHCVVKGDDLCWLSSTCTDAASAHDTVHVNSYFWPNGTSRGQIVSMPGCKAHTLTAREGGRSCFATATMTERQLQECAAKERGPDTKGPCTNFGPDNGWRVAGCSGCNVPAPSGGNTGGNPACGFPRDYLKINVTTGCNPGWTTRVDDATFDPQAGTISGSFHWKVTYAAARGCVPVGGTYWEPGAGDAKDKAPGAPNQAFFCPAAMQAGEPPSVVSSGQLLGSTNCNDDDLEPNGGATWKDYAAAPRSWGECHIPQTETLGPDSCRAKL